MNHSGHLHHSHFLPRVSDKGVPFTIEVVQSLRTNLAPLVQTVQLPEAKLGSFLMWLGKMPQCPALVAPSMPGGRLLVAGSGQGQAHLAGDRDNEATAAVPAFLSECPMCSSHVAPITSFTLHQNPVRKMLLLPWYHRRGT